MSNDEATNPSLPRIDPAQMNGTELVTHYTMALVLPGGLPYIQRLQAELLKRVRRLDTIEGKIAGS